VLEETGARAVPRGQGLAREIETSAVRLQGNVMQLTVARLCLDCEELHDSQQCPRCASEAFAYLTNWVPRIAPHHRPQRVVQPPVLPTLVQRIVFGGGAISLLAYGLMKWSKRAQQQIEAVASRQETGELR
jgi:hypothetical protein